MAPLTGTSSYHIRNTQDWVNEARTIKIEEDEELVSFGVTSLFTSIPTDVAVEVARQRLHDDTKLVERTSLSPDDICELSTLCLKSTQFQFGEQYYEQKL